MPKPMDPGDAGKARALALRAHELLVDSRCRQRFLEQIEVFKQDAVARLKTRQQEEAAQRKVRQQEEAARLKALDDICQERRAVRAKKSKRRLTNRKEAPGEQWRWFRGQHVWHGGNNRKYHMILEGWIPRSGDDEIVGKPRWPGPNPSLATKYGLLAVLHDQTLPDCDTILPEESGEPLAVAKRGDDVLLALFNERMAFLRYRKEAAEWLATLQGYLIDVEADLATLKEMAETGSKAVRVPEADPTAPLSPSRLAELFGVPAAALKKRLMRYRKKHPDGFIEVADRASREAQFLYRLRDVRPVIEGLRTSCETSRKRPA